MYMGDVFAIFGGLLAIGIALPGLLLAWSLILPATVERARGRLQGAPWRCFWIGLAGLLASGVPVAVLLNIPAGPIKFVGWVALFVLLALASVGAAGLAALMGQRLRDVGMSASAPGALLRGAIALELAAAFPLIGWFVVIPIATICVFGAALLALIGRGPRTAPDLQPAMSQQPSAMG
jgi:uncharacterized membrane protein YhaH (DUF805 family)